MHGNEPGPSTAARRGGEVRKSQTHRFDELRRPHGRSLHRGVTTMRLARITRSAGGARSASPVSPCPSLPVCCPSRWTLLLSSRTLALFSVRCATVSRHTPEDPAVLERGLLPQINPKPFSLAPAQADAGLESAALTGAGKWCVRH